jgi:hypothetical protein
MSAMVKLKSLVVALALFSGPGRTPADAFESRIAVAGLIRDNDPACCGSPEAAPRDLRG